MKLVSVTRWVSVERHKSHLPKAWPTGQ